MDETLLHTEPLGHGQIVTQNFDYVLDIPCVNQQNQPSVEVTAVSNLQRFGIFVRPHCREFLQEMSRYFEIAVFTASTKPYCDPILDLIDPEFYITHRLYRDHCTPTSSKFAGFSAILTPSEPCERHGYHQELEQEGHNHRGQLGPKLRKRPRERHPDQAFHQRQGRPRAALFSPDSEGAKIRRMLLGVSGTAVQPQTFIDSQLNSLWLEPLCQSGRLKFRFGNLNKKSIVIWKNSDFKSF